jgi:iron complex outermembrane receptor protein
VPWLEIGAQVSIVRARNRADGGYLVFVPPAHLRGAVTLKRDALGAASDLFASISGAFTARQTRFDLAADFAPPPDAYFLLGAEVGGATQLGGRTVKLAVHGTNLLNQRHRDYTSLLRYFADQPGWQLMLRLSVELSSSTN